MPEAMQTACTTAPNGGMPLEKVKLSETVVDIQRQAGYSRACKAVRAKFFKEAGGV